MPDSQDNTARHSVAPINLGGLTIDSAAIPKPRKRDFRDAWQLSGRVIEVDMVRARDIHRDRLRQERSDRFAPLDVEASRKIIAGDRAGAQAVEVRRQVLRDMTADPRIAEAEIPQDLSALTLDVLIT